MGKIFRYELRRTVGSKFFWGLLAVSLFFGWTTLRTATIRGVAHTAPFSPWSFGAYLSQLMLLLSVALLFFLWNQCNERARRTEGLAAATPVSRGRYLLVKCAAAAAAWGLLALAAAGLGVGFLAALFGDAVPYGQLLLPAAAALLPPMVFLLGVGLFLGQLRPALLFPLMALAMAAGAAQLPLWAEPYCGTLFNAYPLELGTLDPAFTLPAAAVAGRLVYVALGVLFLLAALRRKQKVV